jgi:hypothetical protein
VPPQSVSSEQGPQTPLVTSHAGVVPVQSASLVAEHSPQAPVGWQAGVVPPQSVSPEHAMQVPVASQTGVVPLQSVAERHCTQTFGLATVSHSGVPGSVQSASTEHASMSTVVGGLPGSPPLPSVGVFSWGDP